MLHAALIRLKNIWCAPRRDASLRRRPCPYLMCAERPTSYANIPSPVIMTKLCAIPPPPQLLLSQLGGEGGPWASLLVTKPEALAISHHWRWLNTAPFGPDGGKLSMRPAAGLEKSVIWTKWIWGMFTETLNFVWFTCVKAPGELINHLLEFLKKFSVCRRG